MLLSIFILFFLFIITRCLYLIFSIHFYKKENAQHSRKEPAKTMICIGSGGHTTEMLIIVRSMNPDCYSPRIYVMADTDFTSEAKIHEAEKALIPDGRKQYSIIKISRSRKVLQSYFTSIFTTIYSMIICVPLLINTNPDLILCNGPGTCIPVCVTGFLCKVFCLNTDLKIVFIESFCRVKTISLSGKILNIFADDIIVQWKELLKVCKRAKYFGRLT